MSKNQERAEPILVELATPLEPVPVVIVVAPEVVAKVEATPISELKPTTALVSAVRRATAEAVQACQMLRQEIRAEQGMYGFRDPTSPLLD